MSVKTKKSAGNICLMKGTATIDIPDNVPVIDGHITYSIEVELRAWVKYGGTIVFVSYLSNGYAFLPYLGYIEYAKLLQDAKLLVIENGRVVGEKPCGLEVEE